MDRFLPLMVGIFMLATLVVLGLGVLGLARKNPNRGARSNLLMRFRILFQFVALALFALATWLAQR